MEKKLSKFEIATVKRVAKSISSERKKKAKLEAVIADAQAQLDKVNETIDLFEAPIKAMTGGYTSEQVLAFLANPTSTPTEENNFNPERVDSHDEVFPPIFDENKSDEMPMPY